MNKVRRKALDQLMVKLEKISEVIEELRDEEQEYADNMPENMQGSERHALAEEAVCQLDDAMECIAGAVDAIQVAIGE